jgi:hypothetical protein
VRVSIKIEPTRVYIGWIGLLKGRPAYKLLLDVQLTEEEKYLVKTLGIENQILFTVPYLMGNEKQEILDAQSGFSYNTYLVKYFLQYNKFWREPAFDTLFDAKNAIPMIEDSFRALKQMLDSADVPEHRTFEL